jgi:hypothetical protein
MQRRTRILVIIITLLLIPLLAWLLYALYGDPLLTPARREFKDQALLTIAARLADEPWIAQHIATISALPPRERAVDRWFTEELLLMQNGDWVIAQHACRKRPPGIHDLFIGRASDGKWYYSTFHFCVGFASLGGETQPPTLHDFTRLYHLIEFDGRSDDCLNATWPSPPTLPEARPR